MKKLIDIINTDNEPNILNDMVFGSGGVKTNNMKNIYVIPTDKPSRLILQGSELLLSKYMEVNEGFSEFNQHLFITSDEEIKEGDWIYDAYIKKVIICIGELFLIKHTKQYKKIILTTDQELIEDGVQAIEDEFLEWFVKNPSCEEVKVKKVEFEVDMGLGDSCVEYGSYYKIIIPKEEPKQEQDDSYIKEQKERRRKLLNLINKLEEEKLQEEIVMKETLEEAAKKYAKPFDNRFWVVFKDGAKWQQEQILQFLYSEITERRPYSSSKMCEKVIEFIEQFKKK